MGDRSKIPSDYKLWFPFKSGISTAERNHIEKVADVINPKTNKWKPDSVYQLFDDPVAKQILCMPSSRVSNSMDKIISPFSMHGGYKVSKGYEVLRDEQEKVGRNKQNVPSRNEMVWSQTIFFYQETPTGY